MTRRWRDVLRADPYYSPNLDLREETGDPDLSKPDGIVSLYEGIAAGAGGLRIEGGGNAGQRFFAPGADLTAIVLRARGSARGACAPLVIREAPDRSEVLRTVERSVADLRRRRWISSSRCRTRPTGSGTFASTSRRNTSLRWSAVRSRATS
jgi:hypothetical protein